jgi:hypothetical protein
MADLLLHILLNLLTYDAVQTVHPSRRTVQKTVTAAQTSSFNIVQILVVESMTTREKNTSLFSSTSLLAAILVVAPAILTSAYYQVFPAGTLLKKSRKILLLE